MLKILYAASNNENAKIQLSRFLAAIKDKPYTVKVAAYKKSSPQVNIDWTLDCLQNMFKPDLVSLDNDNFETYFEQVKYYAPDLIISDMEYFTSYIAGVLETTLWQCSSSLINFAVTDQEKYNLGLFKRYSFLLEKNNPLRTQRTVNIIDNSNYKFVYSHLGDCVTPPALKEGFEWIRPYHSIAKESVPCRHNLVAGMLRNNKNIFTLLRRYPDSVAFTEFNEEQHTNLSLKDIENQEEYFCNLKNSNLFICEGQTSFLADAFYNNKYSVVMPNFKDVECITNSIFSEHRKLSSNIYEFSENIEEYLNRPIISNYNDRVQFLHERLDEL
jgi:hypothetical protein